MPRIIPLTTLHQQDDFQKYWAQNTAFLNSTSNKQIEITADDTDTINALVYASYQVPRLLRIAHFCWFEHKRESILFDRFVVLQNYENLAIQYYREMAGFVFDTSLEDNDIPHILMCCGVRWKVRDVNACVPGTKIFWKDLIQQSIVFPYIDNCYVLPFNLLWNAKTPSEQVVGSYSSTRTAIEARCKKLVPNLNINDLVVSYDGLRTKDSLYNFGMCYETLIASSLAVKYYLYRLGLPEDQKFIAITRLYEVESVDTASRKLLENIVVDFSAGIHLPEQEAFVNSENLPSAVIHNRNANNAHHDIILPARISQGPNGYRVVNIAVSCKATFQLSANNCINIQLMTSKKDYKTVELLLWLYLGNEEREKNYSSNVVFANGSGCCNGLALDMFILTKKLISNNNTTARN